MMSARLALNIADLTRFDSIIRQCMITPVLSNDNGSVVVVGPNMDDSAIILNCDDKRGRAVIEFLRMADGKAKRYLTRAYVEGPRGGWRKVQS